MSESTGFSNEDLLLAEECGRIVGACRVVPELAINRVVLRLFIKPGHIEKGAAARLILSALRRAAALKAAKAHADLRENNQAACDLFSKLEFKPIRRYSEMALDLGHRPAGEPEYGEPIANSSGDIRQTLPPSPKGESSAGAHWIIPPFQKGDKGGFCLCPLKPGQEAELTQLQNRVFEGSWGFCPNTTAEIIQLLNSPGYGHDGVIVMYHGETAIGYCWTAQVHRQDGKGGKLIGRIHMMGIASEFRGQGLSKHILSAGVKHLFGKGLHTIELTVDNENNAACSLYRRAGFKFRTALSWYEKQIA